MLLLKTDVPSASSGLTVSFSAALPALTADSNNIPASVFP